MKGEGFGRVRHEVDLKRGSVRLADDRFTGFLCLHSNVTVKIQTFCLQGKNVERVNKAVYLINLKTEGGPAAGGSQGNVQFSCTREQLQVQHLCDVAVLVCELYLSSFCSNRCEEGVGSRMF